METESLLIRWVCDSETKSLLEVGEGRLPGTWTGKTWDQTLAPLGGHDEDSRDADVG